MDERLSDYYTKEELTIKLAAYLTLANQQDAIEGQLSKYVSISELARKKRVS